MFKRLREKTALSGKNASMSTAFQIWMAGVISVAFICTFSFTYVVETASAKSDIQSILSVNAEAMATSISKQNILVKSRAIGLEIDKNLATYDTNESTDSTYFKNAALTGLLDRYQVSEILMVDTKGVAFATTQSTATANHYKFDFHADEQSAEFLVLLGDSVSEMVQDLSPLSYDASVEMMFAGVKKSYGFVQVGYSKGLLENSSIMADISTVNPDQKVGEGGSVLILDSNNKIANGKTAYLSQDVSAVGLSEVNTGFYEGTVYGVASQIYGRQYNTYTILATLPTEEAYFNRNVNAYELAFMEMILFAFIFIAMYVLVRRIVIKNIDDINHGLTEITHGNLNVHMDVRGNAEFASLSDDINQTVGTLKDLIQKEKERMKNDLATARAIQSSAVPNNFPPFPDHDEFTLFASMKPTLDVGGDFYDFFFVSDHQLCLVIADVSGKGIPGAMFMMRAKTLIKNYAERQLTPSGIMSKVNEDLCTENDAGMFVTAWVGLLDIGTGVLSCANAGHEFPMIQHQGGSFEIYHDKHDFVLGGISSAKYREYSLTLLPGDTLFVYTDGVTEATDANNKLFGMDATVKALNDAHSSDPNVLLASVNSAIQGFVGEAPQFDDITMLSLNFIGKDPYLVNLPVEADTTEKGIGFVEDILSKSGFSKKSTSKMDVVLDEILSNVVQYSKASYLKLKVAVNGDDATVVVRDNGTPFDPLKNPEPDTSLPIDERPIGGLGIFLSKKMTKSLTYAYVGGENRLTIVMTCEKGK